MKFLIFLLLNVLFVHSTPVLEESVAISGDLIELDPLPCEPIFCKKPFVWSDKFCSCMLLTTTTSTTQMTSTTSQPTLGCPQANINYGECLLPGQVKISCNGCFKMMIENGILLLYHNNAPGQPPISVIQYGPLTKVCAESDYFVFYSGSSWVTRIASNAGPTSATLLDNGVLGIYQSNPMAVLTLMGIPFSCLSTISTTTTSSPSSDCPQATINTGECLNIYEEKISCNGCFKMFIKQSLKAYHNNVPGLQPIWSVLFQSSIFKVCAGDPFFTYYLEDGSTIGIYFNGPVKAVLMDNGQLKLIPGNPVMNANFIGTPAICNPTTTTLSTTSFPDTGCEGPKVRYSECLLTGQTRYSCNNCFRMTLERGNIVVRYANIPGLPPPWTSADFTHGLADKACAGNWENPNFVFYSSSGILWQPMEFAEGGEMRILDDGRVQFYQWNNPEASVTYGVPTSCV